MNDNREKYVFLQYILLFFVFFLLLQFVISAYCGDEIYNFGFSYAISRGEIPYKDFNMIIPPIGPLIYTIPLLFSKSLFVFNLFQAFLFCLLFYYTKKFINNKAYFLLPLFTVFFVLLTPGYNFLLLLELVILFCLEKEHKNDFLIGIFLGMIVLTKHITGFFICLVSLFYLGNNREAFLKRFLGALLVGFIFIIYLIFSKSFFQFFDLCFFGLFDFNKKNGNIKSLFFIVFLILELVILYKIIKNKKSIFNYYLLAFSSICIPLFDYWHLALFFYIFVLVFLNDINFNSSSWRLFTCSLLIILVGFLSFIFINYKSNYVLSSLNHFELMPIPKNIEGNFNFINSYIRDNKDRNIVMLSNNTYIYKIMNDMDIEYFDLLNYGNHGFNGTYKLIKRVNSLENPLFLINMNEYNSKSTRQQINKDFMTYIMDNYNYIGDLKGYYIYE